MRLLAIVVLSAAIAACGATVSADDKAIEAVQQHVIENFKDPSSATFRNVKVSDGTVCGEVNGKNSFGAYTGHSKFYGTYYEHSDTALGHVMNEDDDAMMAAFGPLYDAHCDEAGNPRTDDERLETLSEQW